MKTFVTVKYRIPGMHHWPGAPDKWKYLRNLHRHEFHFTVWLEVFHDDREVEFIALKGELVDFTKDRIGPNWGKSKTKYRFSCEMVAESIVMYLRQNYPDRDIRVWVEEDGENGAVIETTADIPA